MNFKIKCISNKHNSGDFTIGRIYEVKDGVVYGNREYNSGNHFFHGNYYDSIKEINKDFVPQFELVNENFNFKIRCIDSKNGWFTKGKIYTVNNGVLAVNNGSTFKNMYSLECINKTFNAQFELYEKSLKEKYLQPNKDYYIVLELKNGIFGIIIDDIIYYNDGTYDENINVLDDNLSFGDEYDDVVKIYHRNKIQSWFLTEMFSDQYLDLIWQREDTIPEYTLDELIEKIGHNFKIKK